jgi:hypothetical protein
MSGPMGLNFYSAPRIEILREYLAQKDRHPAGRIDAEEAEVFFRHLTMSWTEE